MKKQQTEPMNPSEQFCPNERCLARGKLGEGNIRIHDRTRHRQGCRQCGYTFSARRVTMLEGLRKPTELIIIVETLLAYGCPLLLINKGGNTFHSGHVRESPEHMLYCQGCLTEALFTQLSGRGKEQAIDGASHTYHARYDLARL